jgi:sirohydrochlorin ferrochelatase
MKALLLIVHGSRKASSTNEIATLAGKIAQLPSPFEHVRHCFLELATPKVNTSITELAELGCDDITLMPYFLAEGFHVAEDLPKLLNEAKVNHPAIQFTLMEHFGAAQKMPQWILEYVSQ